MPKRIVSAALFGVLLLTPLGTSAQTFNPQLPSIPILQPIPAPPCPPSLTYSWCDSLKAQIQTANQVIAIQNQIATTRQQILNEAAYPQQLQNYAQSDLNSATSLLGQLQNAQTAETNVDANVNNTFASISNMPSPILADNQISQNLRTSVIGVLNNVNLASAADSRDADLVTMVKAAGARATSPLQVEQMNLQLLTVMSNQAMRQAALDRTKISAETTAELQQNARAQAALHLQQVNQQRVLQVADPSLPTPQP